MTEHMISSPAGSGVGAAHSIVNRMRAKGSLQSLALIPVIIVVAILGTLTNPAFLTYSNLVNNVLAVSAPLGILVIAESIILIGGYFDLSLQSTVGFSVMLLGVLIASPGANAGFGLPWPVALLVTVVSVLAIGLVNGVLVSYVNLNAFIVTLSMLILIKGFTLGISGGQTYTELPGFVLYLGTGVVAGVPVQVIILVLVVALSAAFMRFTPTGRALYAMGGSEIAARAAGVPTRRMTIGLFVMGSLLALVAGLLLAGKTFAATATLGDNIIFTVFAAAVLGGIDLNGGRGKLIGAGLGVVLLGMIQNLLTLSAVPSFWINAAYGAIILAALLVNKATALRPRKAAS